VVHAHQKNLWCICAGKQIGLVMEIRQQYIPSQFGLQEKIRAKI